MRLAVPSDTKHDCDMFSVAHVTAMSEASMAVPFSGPKQRVHGVCSKSHACMSAAVDGEQSSVCRTQRATACGT